jgi:AraC-like DNA-binding protein
MDMVLFISTFAIINLVYLSVVILKKRSHARANKHISYILLAFAHVIAFNLLIYKKLLIDYSLILFISYTIIFGCPPQFLIIINILLERKKEPYSKKKLLKFVPLIISMGFFVWFYLQPDDYRNHFFLQVQAEREDNPWQMMALDYLFSLQSLIYVSICCWKIYSSRKTKQDNANIRWLRHFINFIVFIGLFIYIPILIPSFSIVIILFCCSISSILFYYYFVYESIKNRTILTEKMQKKQHGTALPTPTISDEIKQELASTITRLMDEEKLFKDSTITLMDLATRCNVPKYILTLYLNQCYGKTFPDFINWYRIEETKEMLAIPENQKYNIEVIAQRCGFKSRSAFYTAFKKQTGCTPVQFLKNNKTHSVLQDDK